MKDVAKNANKTVLITKHLRCNLTESELLMSGKELAETTHELAQLDADKKRVVSDFAAKITERQSRINRLSGVISTGYEFRDVECTVYYHSPRTGEKETFRNDTNDLIAVEKMSPFECQDEMQLVEV